MLPEKADYIVTITGTDEGTMDYSVKTYNECGVLREIGFEDVPVTNGGTYTGEVSQEVFADRENFALEDEVGNVIQPVYDSLPDIDVSISDVIVEEELIDGLPTELIDQVADAIYHMDPEVDVLAYHMTTEDGVAVFSAVAKYYPCEYSLISKSGFRYKLVCDSTTGIVKKIRLYYGEGVDLTEYQKRVNDLNAEVESIVADTVGMSDFEKAVYLHDYIVLNCKYDTELYQM
ncbi:MAG: hypothetical protein IIV88_02725, partial [Erysipelotrichaceae bacterium]|nr:hypothetical protein [Erysipelotrichaceae bacterium]